VARDAPEVSALSEPMWLERARDLIGIREIAGALHEAKILHLWRDAKMPYVHDDEQAWCSAFVCAMLERSMITSTRKPNARSFSDWGINVLDNGVANIPVGAILVWSRPPNAWQGHVNIATARTADGAIECVGGNQSNSVCVAKFRETGGRELIAARWPAEERDNLRILNALPLVQSVKPLSTNEA
jgi:uncharacterized protein (TIGR02594 family)